VELAPPELPPMARNLVELLGVTPTLALVEQVGGQRLYVPRAFEEDSDVVRAIGAKLAAEFARIYGGELIDIPMCKVLLRRERNRAILKDSETLDGNALVKKYRLHIRVIRRILHEMRLESAGSDPRQQSLFR
jgi:Mor family transcriptional regulator